MGGVRFQPGDPVPLRLTIHLGGDGEARLAVDGEVDMATVGPLADEMRAVLSGPAVTRFVVDLAEVGFLDSSGIAALVSAHRQALAARIDFRVVNCRPPVRRVLEITGLDRTLLGGAAGGS